MKIKNLREKLIITLLLILFVALLYISNTPCIFLKLFKSPCPGCGMTRALIAALHLDFNTAFSYHMMFWSVPLLYIAFLFDAKPFRRRYLNISFYIILAAGFAINWIIR